MSCTTSYRHKPTMCTDILWLLFFVLFCVCMIIISVFAVNNGNYDASINGYDSFGNICGKKNIPFKNFTLSGRDTSHDTKVFYFSTKRWQNAMKICAPKCLETEQIFQGIFYSFYKKLGFMLCRYDFNMTLTMPGEIGSFYTNLGPCPELSDEISYPVGHVCIPYDNWKNIKANYEYISSLKDFAEQFFTNAYLQRRYIAILCLVAIGISIILLVSLRFVKKIFFRIIWILVITTNIVLCGMLWYFYINLPAESADLVAEIPRVLPNFIEEFLVNKQILFTLALLSIFTVEAFIILFILLRRQSSQWQILLEEAIKCLIQLPELAFIPLIAVIKFIIFAFLLSYVLLCIATASEQKIVPMNIRSIAGASNPFIITEQIEFVGVQWIRGTIALYIFGFMWISEFIFAFEHFWINSVVANWYFQKSTSSPLFSSVVGLLKHHLGTIAKCSFFTIFKIPRLIIAFFLKNEFEKLVKHQSMLNHTTYAIVAMKSVDFYSAAEIAQNIMVTNSKILGINHAVNFIWFLAKLLVCNIVFLIGVIVTQDIEDFYFYLAPVMMASFFSFLVAHIILSLVEAILDTMVLCICEERQLNKHRGRWVESCIAELFDKDSIKIPVRFIKI